MSVLLSLLGIFAVMEPLQVEEIEKPVVVANAIPPIKVVIVAHEDPSAGWYWVREEVNGVLVGEPFLAPGDQGLDIGDDFEIDDPVI